MSLFLFDLDDTLIHGYLKKVPCDCYEMTPVLGGHCGGCERCNDRGYRLERTQPYSTIEWLPNRLRRLRLIYRHHEVGICTNQTGVTWGHQTVEETIRKMTEVQRQLAEYVSVAPEHVPMSYVTDAHDEYRRKPGPGMIDELRASLGFAHWETTYVGDMETDRQAAKAARVAYSDAEDFFHRLS